MNPITGELEINGTSLIDISDPSKPTTVWHIPGVSKANHRSVSVVYDYAHDGEGKYYLARSLDRLAALPLPGGVARREPHSSRSG